MTREEELLDRIEEQKRYIKVLEEQNEDLKNKLNKVEEENDEFKNSTKVPEPNIDLDDTDMASWTPMKKYKSPKLPSKNCKQSADELEEMENALKELLA